MHVHFFSQRGGAGIFLVVLIAIFALLLTGGFTVVPPPKKRIVPTPALQGFPVDQPLAKAEKTLQLHNLTFLTQTPTPSPSPLPSPSPSPTQSMCGYDNGQACQGTCTRWLVTCQNKQCISIVKQPGNPYPYNLNCSDISSYQPVALGGIGQWCATPYLAPTDGTFCMDKPVIYLYPQKSTYVTVTISTSGVMTKSIPTYSNGWKNILANPNGSILYNKEIYHELFYETAVSNVKSPQDGIIIPKNQLNQTLDIILIKLGLRISERKEFLDYWMKPLNALPGNYILFSLLESTEKNRVDHVEFIPTPDTFISFLAYFRPLYFPTAVKPLELQNTPQRLGFTAVEWGGTIDNSLFVTF